MERALTSGPGGRILTYCNVWSPCGEWIVYDTRSDAAGTVFDGTRIDMVHAHTGEIRTLYESKHGACCGVATWHPRKMQVAFILGPELPTAEWSYGPTRRQGVLVDADRPGIATRLDARDLSGGTPGALRGGSHVHIFHQDGERVSFTYDDDVDRTMGRNVAVAEPSGVTVSGSHPRNHDGTYYSALATRTTSQPRPGTDEISRAFEESWIGSTRSLAFQGLVHIEAGTTLAEVFVVDLPADIRTGSFRQRRVTFTEDRRHPGIQGPRHWLKSSPSGDRIGFLMKDDAGIVQFWTVSPHRGEPRQLTRARSGIGSAFTWSRDGDWIAALVDGCVSRIDAATGTIMPLSATSTPDDEIRPEACVVSPDGSQVAFVRRRGGVNQICLAASR